MKRVVSLWFPRLATDRLARPQPHLPPTHAESRRARDWQAKAAATLAFAAGGTRIAAPNPHAAAAGIRHDMRLADARALVPDLVTAHAEPKAERRLLEAIAGWCERYTPWVAIDPLGDMLIEADTAMPQPSRTSPRSGCGGDAGLLLDVSGCTHLFGNGPAGEQALLTDLVGRLTRHGFACRAALADTVGAAWALARFAERQADLCCPPSEHRGRLAILPVEGLRLAPDQLETLHRLGLRRIGDLYPLPRGPLQRRFGDAPNLRLDQALGRCSEAIEPRRPAPSWRTRLMFTEPIGKPEDIAAATERLLAAICSQFEHASVGARQLELALFRVDGTVERTAIGTGRPNRDVRHLFKLFEDRLAELDPGFGVELMMLTSPLVEPLTATQMDLNPSLPAERGERGDPRSEAKWVGEEGASPSLDLSRKISEASNVIPLNGAAAQSTEVTPAPSSPTHAARGPPLSSRSAGREGLKKLDQPTSELVDRLTQRLGGKRVLALHPRASHLPERAVAARPAAQPAARPEAWAAQAALKAIRPIRLLASPEPIDVTAPLPDDPPRLFRWRQTTHRMQSIEGPERLIDEWWYGNAVHDGSLQGQPHPRDYYRFEDETGQRFWIYRDGPLNNTSWFLHGFYS